MPAVEIRNVSAEDHAAWLPLWQAYQRFYETTIAERVSAVTWQRMLDPAEPINAALAWVDGVAVGMVHWIYHRSCWTVENSCYLQDLIVSPELRGTGIGRTLIEFVYAQARADGCIKVHWLTHESNTTGIQLYERLAERPGFIQFRKPL
ncbi:putative acetyltransferase [compost metagenome]